MKKNVINENKVIVEGKTPKIKLNEQSQAQGGVSIEEGILLAKQLARKIIELKTQKKMIKLLFFNL